MNSTAAMTTRIAAGILFAMLLTGGGAAAQNVVLIVSDDQAWTDYSFLGHAHIETPNLDRLARQSLTFTRGYVPESLCRPSLASIVTGLYPHQHGIVGNDPPLPAGAPKSDRNLYLQHIDRVKTLPGLLRDAGYLCFQSGKWWEGPFSRGGFTHGMTHGDVERGGRHGDEGLKIGRQGLAPIQEFLETAQAESKPFFIWYAPMLPHTPHNPPQRLLDKYRDKTPHLPVAKYWAMCEWFDETVGELLGELEKRGLSDNTLVAYVTDNGWINRPDQSAYAERSKRSQYDGGLRTPIMIRTPGRAPRMESERLASSIDLAPTILAWCKLPKPEAMPGINLLDDQAVAARDAVFGGIFEHDIVHMTRPVDSLRYRWVVAGNWKLIAPNLSRLPDAPTELYDIVADPHERRNLAQSHPAVVADLERRLDAWWPARQQSPAEEKASAP